MSPEWSPLVGATSNEGFLVVQIRRVATGNTVNVVRHGVNVVTASQWCLVYQH